MDSRLEIILVCIHLVWFSRAYQPRPAWPWMLASQRIDEGREGGEEEEKTTAEMNWASMGMERRIVHTEG